MIITITSGTVIASLSSTVLPPLGITILGMAGALSAALPTKFNLKKRKSQLQDAIREANTIKTKQEYIIVCNEDVNKFGDKATGENESNMHGNSTVGLPTHIGALTDDGDAISRNILLDVIENLNHISLTKNGTNKMTGDLLMDSSNNDSVSIGCADFGAGEKSFGLCLGNVHNGLLYNNLVES